MDRADDGQLARVLREQPRHLQRAGTLRAHAQRERGEAASQQPAIEWRERRTRHALPLAQPLEHRSGLAHRHDAGEHVAVTAEVLGGAVHHDVDAEVEWPLAHRRRKGVVADDERPGVVAEGRELLQVRDVEERVRRCLEPQQTRAAASPSTG